MDLEWWQGRRKKNRETSLGLPCGGVPVTDMRNQRMRCLGNQGREECEFRFRNTASCCCCCWRNVQENLSSWDLKSSECWEEDLYFKVSRIYLIHKWMREFRGTGSSERKSHPRTEAHLLLTCGSQVKVLKGEEEERAPEKSQYLARTCSSLVNVHSQNSAALWFDSEFI